MPIAVKYVLTAIQVVLAVILTFVVLAQSGKQAGIAGAIGGGADTFLSKNKAKTWDARLARWTKWICIIFLVLTLVLTLLPATAATPVDDAAQLAVTEQVTASPEVSPAA